MIYTGLKGEKNPLWGKRKDETSFYGKKHKSETIARLKEIKANQPKGGDSPRAKKVNTPIGQYACQKDAAIALNISRETLRTRIKNNKPGYSYI